MSRFSKILSGSYLHFPSFAAERSLAERANARKLQLPTLAGLVLELVKDTLAVLGARQGGVDMSSSLSP